MLVGKAGTKTGMGKSRLSKKEAQLLDSVRGPEGRGVWLRDVAIRYAEADPAPDLAWPSDIPTNDDRDVDVGFRLTPAQIEAINRSRGGIPLGVWVREAGVRVASALRSQQNVFGMLADRPKSAGRSRSKSAAPVDAPTGDVPDVT